MGVKQTIFFFAAASALFCNRCSAQSPRSSGGNTTSGSSTQSGSAANQTGSSQIDSPGVLRPGTLTPTSSLAAPAQIAAPALPPGAAVTLEQALALAQANEPAFAASVAAAKIARLDQSIAKAALLPSVVYHNQYLFTSSNHLPNATVPQVFIANNAVHEYASQGIVTETLGFAQRNGLAQAGAALAIANAELEVSRRGLTAAVTGLYYSSSVSQGRIQIQQRAVDEATDFVKQTTQREIEREVAHADVLKAQLTLQQRQRDLIEAQLAADKARLDLGVLLYPDPRTPYTVALPVTSPLPDRAMIDAAVNKNNPELASATASLRASQLGVIAAKAAYFPSLALNYAYGIDAPYLASRSPDGAHNLGYSASATLDIPVWDWLATEHKVKQAQYLRDAAKVQLTATQRRLIANVEEFYNEMRVAHDQLASLAQTASDSRESLRLTRLRYGSGEGTVLEVVDAQNTLTLAELALQDGTVRYQLALATLQTLTGAL